MSIEADLTALYTAGRQQFPDHADLVSGEAKKLGGVMDDLNRISAYAGDSAVLTDALSVLDDIYDALRQTVQTINDCAVGLVNIADDYANRDAETREAMKNIEDDVDYEHNPPAAVPEDNGDPETPGDYSGSGAESTPDPESPDDDKAERDQEVEDNTPTGPAVE